MNNYSYAQNKTTKTKPIWIGISLAVLIAAICISAIGFAYFSAQPLNRPDRHETVMLSNAEPRPTLPASAANIIFCAGDNNLVCVQQNATVVFGNSNNVSIQCIYQTNDFNKQNTNAENGDTDFSNNNRFQDNEQPPIRLSEEEIVAQNVVSQVQGKSDYEKVKYFHDYICENTVYDHENVDNGIITTEASSAYGSLVQGLAVCSGYAKAFQLLCDTAGIEVYYVVGQVDTSLHAWNVVKVDGAYYQIDTTWDDTQNGYTYDFFLVTDAYMEQSRSWDRDQTPACVSDKYILEFYPVANSLEEMKSIVQNAYQHGQGNVMLLTTFAVDLNSEQVSFLFQYDLNGNGTYEYYPVEHFGNYYKVGIIL